MNDLSLLIFGCGVSFIAVAGAYVYLREAYEKHEREIAVEARPSPAKKRELRDVA